MGAAALNGVADIVSRGRSLVGSAGAGGSRSTEEESSDSDVDELEKILDDLSSGGGGAMPAARARAQLHATTAKRGRIGDDAYLTELYSPAQLRWVVLPFSPLRRAWDAATSAPHSLCVAVLGGEGVRGEGGEERVEGKHTSGRRGLLLTGHLGRPGAAATESPSALVREERPVASGGDHTPAATCSATRTTQLPSLTPRTCPHMQPTNYTHPGSRLCCSRR